jgi:hypothetical protein
VEVSLKKLRLIVLGGAIAVSGVVVTPAPAQASCNGPEIDPCPLVNAVCRTTDPAYKVRDKVVNCEERY